MDRLGFVKMSLTYNDITLDLHVEVLKHHFNFILGLPQMEKLGLTLLFANPVIKEVNEVPSVLKDNEPMNKEEGHNFNEEEKFEWDKLQQLLELNSRIDTSESSCSHPLAVLDIKTKNDEEISYVSRRNFVNYGQYEVVDKQVSNWLETGVIGYVPADSTNCFPLLVVDKKNEHGVKTGDRVCVDLRKANDLLVDDDYPIPTLQDVFNKLGEHNGKDAYRSKIDCTAAYHGVRITGKRICF